MTADLMVAIMTSEELAAMNQLAFKVLKNRDNDVTQNRKFVVGVNRSLMRLYDVDDKQQTLIGGPVQSDALALPAGNNFSKYRTLLNT